MANEGTFMNAACWVALCARAAARGSSTAERPSAVYIAGRSAFSPWWQGIRGTSVEDAWATEVVSRTCGPTPYWCSYIVKIVIHMPRKTKDAKCLVSKCGLT